MLVAFFQTEDAAVIAVCHHVIAVVGEFNIPGTTSEQTCHVPAALVR